MCIAGFAWQAHPLYPFLLLHNRDEYHSRPTAPVGWWEGGEILGGRDELRGGTWLACSRGGRVAFVTNVLELHTSEAKSRGELPVRFLESRKSPKEFAEEMKKEAHLYNGFNLILADLSSKSMFYITNRPKGEPISIQGVSPGLHVLSNAKLDSPWPKAERLKIMFEKLLHSECEIPITHMAAYMIMQDTVKADKSRLPHIRSPEWEHGSSSIFVSQVDTPRGNYGTRSTTVLTVSDQGEVSFFERYLEDDMWKEKTVDYCIQKAS